MSERDFIPTEKVQGKSDKPFDLNNSEEDKEKEKRLEKLQEYTKNAEKMLDSYHLFFMTFAKDVSLDIKLSNKFQINLEKGIVEIDTSWFFDREYSPSQIIWACLHEFSHFIDLKEDPKGYEEKFNHAKQLSRKTGLCLVEKMENYFGKSHPDFIELIKNPIPISEKGSARAMNPAEMAAFKIHWGFFNAFDDIFVNNLVSRRASNYEADEEAGKEIKKLYQKKLFAGTDYSNLPKHLQFTYKLLREEMVRDEEVKVDEEVEAIMKQKIQFQNKLYYPKEIVENFIKPKLGRNTKGKMRFSVLEKTLAPIFENLLLEDINNWKPKMPDPKEENNEEPDVDIFKNDYTNFEMNNPDKISPDTMQKWIDKSNAEKEATETKIENDPQKERNQAWCKLHNINYSTFQEFKTIQKEVDPYLKELSALWQKIIYGSGKITEREMQGYYKTGDEMSIQKVIDEWPSIEKKNLEKVSTMKKMVTKESLAQKPELIRIRLVGDVSVSMRGQKEEILQRLFVLILTSIREFNTHLNLTRSKTKSKLKAESEGWTFGHDTQRVKSFESEIGSEEELVEIVKIFEKVKNPSGRVTNDNLPLEKILKSLSSSDRINISEEKIMEIVFEITDGGSTNADLTRAKVNELDSLGVIIRSFQIGEADSFDSQTFEEVWISDRKKPLGQVVGSNIGNLIPAVTEALKEYLGHVRL
jgi:hypothetical protein